METAVLLVQCPDTTGIVAKVSECIFRLGGNITRSDQHSTDPEGGRFFIRVEFTFDETKTPKTELEAALAEMVQPLEADWQVNYASRVMRMGILVSKYDHCLIDLLYRKRSGELNVDIPLIVSNHEAAREWAERYEIPFHHIPVTKETKLDSERALLDLLRDSTDFLVLTRYMQILSDGFLAAYKRDIINIHHSFLPSFKGANPYRQAYDRGVKIIGATAHFATADLDEGPIIAQDVERVSPKDDVAALMRKGRNLEKLTLADAVRAYLEHRIIRHAHKTIVFE
jgi:formyltetrahydrofolate deformylase